MGKPHKPFLKQDMKPTDTDTDGHSGPVTESDYDRSLRRLRGSHSPIAVKILQFREPGISGPGLQMATSCSIARPGKPQSRHTIEYHPWFRAFLVTYTEPHKEPYAAYIPEHCVVCWYPA